jgi:hypothetical protein
MREWPIDANPAAAIVLRLACEALDRAVQARKVVEAEGLSVIDRYGQVKPHPAASIEAQSRAAVLRMLAALDLVSEDAA